LKEHFGGGGIDMMKQIKKGMDPNNIMNPGKVVIIAPKK
jgi:FAD/FMN-containing dehydrogenase